MERTNETIAAIINPIVGRHIPYRLENGDLVIQDDIILLTDQLDGSVCACKATPNNLILLGIIPMSTSESIFSMPTTTESLVSLMPTTSEASISPMCTTSDSESQVMDPGSSQITKISTKWSRDATLFLIDQWQKNFSNFASTTIRNEEVWKNIAKELKDAGFIGYTSKQAEDKWKNLRKAYMKVKDNMGDTNSGAARITCKFYDELDEIFRKSPSVKPISVASSRDPKSLSDTVDTDSDKDYDKDLKHQPKKKKSKLEKDIFTLLSTFKDDASVREAARENRHQQTLNTLNRAIDSYEAQMQKLIDKL